MARWNVTGKKSGPHSLANLQGKNRARSIRAVRRYSVLLATLAVLLLAAVPRLRALTDEEKKAEFLEATQGDYVSPTPTPSPSPHHKRHVEAEATPHHRRSPTPAAEETPTPGETPEPSETPAHHHHASADESASTEETPEASETPVHLHHTAEEAETPAHRHHHPSPTPEPTARKHPHPEEEETPAPVYHEETPPPSVTETPAPRPSPARTPIQQPVQQTYVAPVATPIPEPIPRATPAPTPVPGPWGAQVDIEKQGLEEEGGFVPPPPPPPTHHHWWQVFSAEPEPQYHYLTKEIRDAIDRAPVARRRWRFIVVHNSGTRQGNARIFDYYHRYVRKMPNGLAYHFVIGNGTASGNGQIEIGGRWIKQLQGGHVHSDYLNNISLGICLVGDFNRDLPTKEQLEALDELIRYLRIRVGKIDGKPAIVKAHKEINPPQWPTDCPGDRFPYHWLHERFD